MEGLSEECENDPAESLGRKLNSVANFNDHSEHPRKYLEQYVEDLEMVF